jgi:hypothetical protein
MRTPGQPGYGLPPREGIVDLTRDVADLKAQVAALQAVQANSLQISSVYQQANSLDFPNDSAWHYYCLTATYEPPPWAGRLTYFFNVSAGTTFTTSGALAVQTGSASNGGPQSQAGVSRALNGTGAVSVEASFTGSNTFAPGTFLHNIFSVFVAAAGASNTGSGNANINGVLFWSRA